MRFIHCADIHLDSKMETNLSSPKAKERKKEILNTFERMVAYATENDVKAIIIAGDMFDTAILTQKFFACFFFKKVRGLAQNKTFTGKKEKAIAIACSGKSNMI